MEPKKDYIIQKIRTERGFADEIFKKYRHERYGIGSCCGSNLPSYIKDKYLCDFEDAKVTPYESIKITKTSYTPPTPTGAKQDENRPPWVNELCGITQGDAEIYFYYDTTSLGVQAVQDAYYAAKDWVDQLSQAQPTNDTENCTGGDSAKSITTYHTLTFGERWLDWGTQAITGDFNNSGSCGGNGTVDVNGDLCGTGSNVNGNPVNVDPIPGRNFGLQDCGSGADSTYPQDVAPDNKFWSSLQWAQNNGIQMHSFGPAGGTVATVTLGNDTSGGVFNGVTTIGQAPAATNKNLLVVCFIDESTSRDHKQPYHDRSNNTSWNTATDGAGNMTPCWKADHTEFIAQRNLWMAADSNRQSNFFVYPSMPSGGAGTSHRPFPLHALGAVTSGDKNPADGTLTVAPSSLAANPQLLTPITTSNPYFAQGYGALDQHGWGTNVAMVPFTAATFQTDLNAFVDIQSCNDSECFLFVVKDQNGNPIEDHPIKINSEIIGYTDENGLLRWCVRDASINTQHVLDLCTCLTTTGGCGSQKINMTITDSCFTSCDTVKPFTACEEPEETQSSGNDKEGCTDPSADNYDPEATIDDGSCKFCDNFSADGNVIDATETAGVCNNDGEIELNITGGVPPYTITWSGPGGPHTGTELTGLCGGSYLVTVTDSSTPEPCQAFASFNVNQPTSIIYGCTDPTACNYDATATDDDGSCLFSGCTDSGATNYDPNATADCNCTPQGDPAYQNAVGWNSCCTACVDGCMDPNANNYNAAATCDDGSCTYNYSCVQLGGTGTQFNACENHTYIGATFDPNTAVNHVTDPANNLTNAILGQISFSSLGAPVASQCLDQDGNKIMQLNMIGFQFQDNGTPCNGETWPATWTAVGMLPNTLNNNAVHFTGVSWDNILTLFNDTIALGQIYYDSQGTVVTTFNGLNRNQVELILYYSQGTGTPNPGVYGNELLPECPTATFGGVAGSGPCICSGTSAAGCECQEMLDGSGTYPTLQDCQQDPGSCCNVNPSTSFVCVPGGITNSCSNKQLVPTSSPISTSTNLGDNLAQAWTSDVANWPIVPVQNYKFYVDQGGGNCEALTGNSEWFIREIRITNVDNGTFVSVGDVAVPNSWAIVQAALVSAFYDGINYPDLSNADYMTVKTTLATTEPGKWSVETFEQMCNCTTDGNCDCVEDPSGTYSDYQTCIDACCTILNTYGCTDSSAFNYSAGANLDDGSCLYCNDLNPSPVDNIITANTAPTSGMNDGTIFVQLSSTVPANMLMEVKLYDATDNSFLGQEDISALGFATTFPNLGANNYYVIACLRHDTSTNQEIICCSPTLEETLGNPGGGLAYSCISGTLTVTDNAFTSTANDVEIVLDDPTIPQYYKNNVAQYNAGNTSFGYYDSTSAGRLSMLDHWTLFIDLDLSPYVNSNATVFTTLDVATPWAFFAVDGTEPTNACLNNVGTVPGEVNSYALRLSNVKIRNVRDINTVLIEMDTTASWFDITTTAANTLNNPELVNAKYTTVKDALTAEGTWELIADFIPLGCESDCRCVVDPAGTFSTFTECVNSGCCTTGCTESGADNINPSAGIDINSCVVCTDFSGINLSNNSPSVPNGNSGNWSASNLNISGYQTLWTGLNGSGNYDVAVYYDGYNQNQPANPFNLFPGRYEVCVSDMTNNCTHCTRNVNIGTIPAACRTSGSNWLPTTAWGTGNQILNYIQSGDPILDSITNLYSYDPNHQIQWGINATNTGAEGTTFLISNLNSAVTYTINVYNNSTGALHQTASGVSALGVTNAVPGTTYDIEIIREGQACGIIGMPYTFSPPGF